MRPAMNLLRPVDRDVIVNGLKLHLLDWGGEGRTPLVLLHGFTGNAHAWDTLSIALQPHFRVYAVDQRGHGDSDPADVPTACSKNASVWHRNGSSSGISRSFAASNT